MVRVLDMCNTVNKEGTTMVTWIFCLKKNIESSRRLLLISSFRYFLSNSFILANLNSTLKDLSDDIYVCEVPLVKYVNLNNMKREILRGTGVVIKRDVKSSSVFSLVKNYSPSLNVNPMCIKGDICMDVESWIGVRGLYFCQAPEVVKNGDGKWGIFNNVLRYYRENKVYLLLSDFERHKLVTVFDDLTINLDSSESVFRYQRVQDGFFLTSVFKYNVQMQDWVLISKTNPIPVLGTKRV